MPTGAVDRALEYVAILLLLTTASTFAWWIGAQVARCEYRRVMSALACSMRIFFYSICLMCILVALRAFNFAPHDPRSTLFGWIHIGGTIWVCGPSAWRAFRERGLKLVVAVAVGGLLCLVAGWVAYTLDDGFRHMIQNMPRYLSKA